MGGRRVPGNVLKRGMDPVVFTPEDSTVSRLHFEVCNLNTTCMLLQKWQAGHWPPLSVVYSHVIISMSRRSRMTQRATTTPSGIWGVRGAPSFAYPSERRRSSLQVRSYPEEAVKTP
jgi:hypothetical protein